jgi:hypothetical protein
MKACAAEKEPLLVWAEQQSGQAASFCEECRPQTADAAAAADDNHLTKLEQEILDYVLEIAVLHLDNPQRQYRFTVQEIADCLDKTPAQVTTPLWHLIEREYLALTSDVCGKDDIQPEMIVYPTNKALRTEPAFERLPEDQLAEELDGLRSPES